MTQAVANKAVIGLRIIKCLAVLLLGIPFGTQGQMTSLDLVEMDRALYSSYPPKYPTIELMYPEDQVWLDSLCWVREQSLGLKYVDYIPTLNNIIQHAKSPVLQDGSKFWLGIAHHKAGEDARAFTIWDSISYAAHESGDSLLLYWTGQQLASLSESSGSIEGSKKYLYPALDYFRRRGVPYLEASVTADLAGLAFEENKLSLADSLYNQASDIFDQIGARRKTMRAKLNLNSVWLQTLNALDSTSSTRDSIVGLQLKNYSDIERLNAEFKDSLIYIDVRYYRDIYPFDDAEENEAVLDLILELRDVADRSQNERKISLMMEAEAFYHYQRYHDTISAPMFGDLCWRYDSLGLWADAAKASEMAADSYSYTSFKDSIPVFLNRQIAYLKRTNDSAKSKASAFYEARFKIQDQARQLTEARLISANRKNTLILVIAGASIILLLSLLAYRNQRTKRKTAQLQLINQEQTAQQEVQTLMEQHRFDTLVAQVKGEEAERDRLAKEIHDGVGGVLAGIALKMESEHADSTEISSLAQALRKTHDDLRNISHNLALPELQDNTLVELSKELLGNLRKMHGFEIGLNVFPQGPLGLDRQLEVQLYRVLQELTSNIVKHANATQIEVSYTLHPDELNLIVADNGKGFDPTSVKNGLGQRSIRDRVAPFGGEVRVESSPGNGTTATVVIPNPKRRAD